MVTHGNSWVLGDHNFGMSQPCDMNAKKANAILGHINRNIRHRGREATTPWHSAFVRWLLESSVPLWAPRSRQDLKMESVRNEHLK